jgi:HSP20 family protein
MTGHRRQTGDLQGEIQELIAELWQVPRFVGQRHGFRPQCDCYRTDDPPALHLTFELPGIDPATLAIETTERTLVLSGRRERPQPPGARWHQVEIDYGPFERRIDLAEDVEPEVASTSYENGLLHLELPLAGHP